MRTFLTTLLSLAFASALFAADPSAADLDKRRKALNDLIQEQWEYQLRRAPEYASMLGDKRYNDRSSDLSEAAVRRDARESVRFLNRFEAISPAGFSEQERLNRELMIRNLRDDREEYELKIWEMPVTQMSGIHLMAAQFPSLLTFQTARDYDDYIKRLGNFSRQVDDTIAIMRHGMRDKRMPPKFLLEKVTAQAEQIGGLPPDKSPFAASLSKFPATVGEGDRARIRTAMLAAIADSVLPAYGKFAKFVREEYAP